MKAPSRTGPKNWKDVLTQWCFKWKMQTNAKKSEVMHIRNYQKPRCETLVFCCTQKLNYTNKYKYLGYIIDECLTAKHIVEALTRSATRAFGKIASIFKKLKNMGIKAIRSNTDHRSCKIGYSSTS